MPELPEVETAVRGLRAPLVGRTITAVHNDWPRHIAIPAVAELQARLPGNRVVSVDRRAKYLVFSLSGGDTLLIHLKMTGHLAVVDQAEPPGPYVHTTFVLDDGRELRFRDTRKFGRVYLVADRDEVLGKLGPEPLEDAFTKAMFAERLDGRKRVIKPLLLDQTFVAGIGNIYADEALFRAGIMPTRRSDTLTVAEIGRLHAAIRQVLALGVENEGASIDSYVKPDGEMGDMQNLVLVFGRTGEPCATCGMPIEKMVLGGRGTHYCPHCQS